jgi:hypothetical protein
MNNTQKLVSLISGYEPKENSAQDDGYYEITLVSEAYKYLLDVIAATDDIDHSADIYQAYDFLEDEFEGEEERYHAFKSLTDRK